MAEDNGRSLYWVVSDVDQTGIGPTRGELLVIATDKMNALDKVAEHPDANPLRDDPVWDREVAESQIAGNSTTRCAVENDCDKCRRKLQVREAAFAGQVDDMFVEIQFKSEGISASQYTDGGDTMLDEAWYTWKEVVGGRAGRLVFD